MKHLNVAHRLGMVVLSLVAMGAALVPRATNGQQVQAGAERPRLQRAAASFLAGSPVLRRPAAASYDVVALRVEFQPDTTRFTTGDGTFEGGLYDGLTPSVDPLPHDAAYFEAHLAFLASYVARVSDARTQVRTHLVPEVVRVARPMSAYSPTGPEAGSEDELAKLARLVEEAWRLAGEQSDFDLSGFDPATTAFVLFHAGVGRDIELIGTTLDRTPQDLPSLFFDGPRLSQLLDQPLLTFNGFPVTNTLILPRTETRRGFDVITDTAFLAEFSTNGLMAASFFNYLGVPDLFDTATGQSAIGPFGLMDPLGIFALNGLFPPEPCAWTKYYLGWAEPQELRGDGPVAVSLSAAGLHDGPGQSRAWISEAEYFLIENRHRDTAGDGLLMRVWKDNTIVEQRVENGDETFNAATIEGFIGGVVVDVDDYDWALPGGVDEADNPLNGGVLIWHVDERRLQAGLADNRVNADPERRAIDLEEADSGQDLGFPSGGLFGPQNELGTPFDFFYSGNPVAAVTELGGTIRLYQNRFGPDTYPNSDSNEGGASFVVLEDFSAPGVEMTLTFRREARGGVAPAAEGVTDGQFGPDAFLTSLASAEADTLLLAYSGTVQEPDAVNLWVLRRVEESLDVVGTASLLAPPAVTAQATGGEGRAVLLARQGGIPWLWFAAAEDLFGEASPPAGEAIALSTVGDLLPATPVVLVEEEGSTAAYVVFGTGEAATLVRAVAGEGATARAVPEVSSLAAAGPGQLALVGRSRAAVAGSDLQWTYSLGGEDSVGQAAFGMDAGGLVGVVPAPGAGRLVVLTADGSTRDVDVAALAGPAPGALSAYPVLADLDRDGFLDVLTTYGDRLVAVSQAGAPVRGFPRDLPAAVTAQPLVAELTPSGSWSVLLAATDGYVYAYDLGARGESVAAFPLAAGFAVHGTPLLQDKNLFAASAEGALRLWRLGGGGASWWSQRWANGRHQSFVVLPGDPEPPAGRGGLLVEEETYNWPNPIRDGRTYVRCVTRQDAQVRVTVVDGAGTTIDTFTMENVRGGVPASYQWTTDAASGVYYARITATGEDGATETHLLKMAIIR